MITARHMNLSLFNVTIVRIRTGRSVVGPIPHTGRNNPVMIAYARRGASRGQMSLNKYYAYYYKLTQNTTHF